MTAFLKRYKTVWITLAVTLLLTVAFHFLQPGDDWETFWGTAKRVLAGLPLYNTPVTFSYFYYPPWTAVLLAPFGWLPFDWAYSLFSALTMVGLFFLARKWGLPLNKMAAVFLSPPVIYSLIHGQIDWLVICLMLLPEDLWLLAALFKPQTAIGLVGVLFTKRRWQMLIAPAVLLILSFIFYGLWPLQLIKMPNNLTQVSHNLWLNLWPSTIPVGVGLLLVGLRKKDEKMLLASSPFFSPYCPISTLIGLWMMLAVKLETWILYVVLAAWWGADILQAVIK
jgi:hypothetical protein